MATTLPPVRAEGRVPPHDLEAEASVLGALLLDPTAVTRVLDLVDPEDFYRENNAQIYRAATSLFREGEPIDNITLAAELEKMGVLERVGGRAHLAMLQEQTPTAGNIEHYARIVRDRAYKRRLITAGGRVTSLGFEESLDAEEAVNQAQAEVFGISDQRIGSSMERLYDLLKPAMDRIDNQMASGGAVVGVASGFHDLDRITNGFKPSDMVVIAARPSMGKALALDTPIPTPDGWRTMGGLRVGDQVFDERGRPCTVTYATPILLGRGCYEVVFSDGERLVADAEHLWATSDRVARRRGDAALTVRTTGEILTSLRTADGRANHLIPSCAPLQYPERRLPLDPYVMGAWLGAGREPAVTASAGPGGRATAVAAARIPRPYLEASVAQRIALLQGLFDAGHHQTLDRPLGDDVRELVIGLGLVANAASGVEDESWREIREIRPTASVAVRCIQVDSPSHLYLAGRACVPTHNTSFVLNVALHAAVEHKQPVAIFSLEMSKEQLVERMLCEHARIDAQRLHRGLLSEAEHERLVYSLGPLGDAPIYIDDAPMLDDLSLRLKARQARSREGIEMIVIDYLQLMHGRQRGGDDANRVQEVSAISRSLKGIARELQVPVLALSQLSRAPEQRPDKRPILSDLRESGCLTDDTRLLRADTGAPVAIRELMDRGCDGVLVWSVGEQRRLTPAPLLKVFASGVKRVFRLSLGTGREVKASGNHRFLTPHGWRELDRLRPGDRIATPRRVPAPATTVPWKRDRLALLAHLIGDGRTLAGRPLHYADIDPEGLEVVARAARREFGVDASWAAPGRRCTRVTLRGSGPIEAWLSELGVFGLRCSEMRVPDAVFGASDDDIAHFLGHLWATCGCISDGTAGPAVWFGSASRRLAEDVSVLLLRLGIASRTLWLPGEGAQGAIHQAWVTGAHQVRALAARLPMLGTRGRRLQAMCSVAEPAGASPKVVALPLAVAAGAEAERAPRRDADADVDVDVDVDVEGTSTVLEAFPSDDVVWDRIDAIDDLGEQPVYDGTVAGTHNFVADGIVAHNSIEQDADLVMFLYRDDYYNRDKSEKPGIAEIIVAKHRNGPTGVVELLFRKELTRFENLDRRRPQGTGGIGPDE